MAGCIVFAQRSGAAIASNHFAVLVIAVLLGSLALCWYVSLNCAGQQEVLFRIVHMHPEKLKRPTAGTDDLSRGSVAVQTYCNLGAAGAKTLVKRDLAPCAQITTLFSTMNHRVAYEVIGNLKQWCPTRLQSQTHKSIRLMFGGLPPVE